MTAIVPGSTTHIEGAGELIRAHRVYMGLSQREICALLDIGRRGYQLVENGTNNCPVTLWARVSELVNTFDEQVDTIISEASRMGRVELTVPTDPSSVWERNVAGRAAVLTHDEPDQPTITLVATNERSK